MSSSRIQGLHLRSIEERRRLVAEQSGVPLDELALALGSGGIDATTADGIVENVIGTYALPFAVATNFVVNGRDVLVPMVVEEPSVVAAASNAAKMVREGGGFTATADESIMEAQVELRGVRDINKALTRVADRQNEICRVADHAVSNLVLRGGGARYACTRRIGEDALVVHVGVDVRDAMGANLVNTVAEAVASTLADLTGGTVGLKILTNLTIRRLARVRVKVPTAALATDGLSGELVRDGIVAASNFASRDPYRAATHNKGIMNGVDAVVMATGNDWRAVEAGAHAFAALDHAYDPLSEWWVSNEYLIGNLTIPLALGTVGGTLRVHPGARMALKILGVSGARELAMVAASAGLASNLAALRALATEGIQRGHMSLHARSVAQAAGATGDEIEKVAATIAGSGRVTVDAATSALTTLRGENA